MKIIKYHTELETESGHAVLVKDSACLYPGDYLEGPKMIVEMLNSVFRMNRMAEEYVYMLAFNTKMRLTGLFEISHGTVDCSSIRPREVFLRALLSNACNIVIVHNHPSGDPSLSRADVQVLNQMKDAGKIMGIELMDYIIIGAESYYSMKEAAGNQTQDL